MADDLKEFRLTQWEMRRIFNGLRFTERAEQGELEIYDRGHNVLQGHRHEPDGTTSGPRYFYDSATRQRLAVAHVFQRPDGSLGGSGRPDPKYLVLFDCIFMHDPKLILPSDQAL
jgi:hypothetical protein